MKVTVWLAEGTWRACVDAVSTLGPELEITLLHVADDDVGDAMRFAYHGLLSRHGHDPADTVDPVAVPAERALLDDAKARLGRECAVRVRHGHVEREVVAACADADVLVCARDGERGHAGPKSLGHHTRFVVDHAPCAVLLVWPG
ncbi:universal stress protein [Amycolatopsis minnesotensis]|uniref:UspA domain-containing protein n=1 Tax=Amycolatopsis minnesotensis TaxID=337894 RepID=A0ABN2RI98_9PSEU